MAFDFFTQPRGPEIDISLYPDAATKGIAAGNAQKTPLQGVVAGIEQGLGIYEDIQKIQSNELDLEIKENRVEQLPVENRLREAQASNQESIAQMQGLEAELAADTQTIQIDTVKSELEARKAKADDAAGIIEKKNKFQRDFGVVSPEIQKSLIFGGEYDDVFTAYPQVYERAAGSIYRTLNPAEQTQVQDSMGFLNSLKVDKEKQKLNNQFKGQVIGDPAKAIGDLVKSAPFQYALTTGGINTVDDVNARMQVFPKGVKTVNEKGFILSGVADKPQDPSDTGKYTLFLDGKPLLDISETDATKFNTFKTSTSQYEGLVKESVYGPEPKPLPKPTPQITIAPPDAAATGNQRVVANAREKFEALKKEAPPGIDAGTIDERLKLRKQKIREGVAALKTQKLTEQGVTDLQQTLSQGATTAPTIAPQITPSPTPPSPAVPLSAALKRPVALNMPQVYSVTPEAWQRIHTEPLLNTEPAIIKGLAAVESAGQRDAVSPTGVRGLLQVTQATAAQYGLNRNIPEQNVTAGKLALYDNMLRFNGNLRLALAAYNVGPGAISDAIRATQSTKWEDIRTYLAATLSASKFKEVSEYPDKVLSMSSQFLGQGGDSDASLIYSMDQNNLIKPMEV